MAQSYVAEGNPDRAIEEFKLTLMYDPNSPLVYARLATEYIKKGMLTAAMEACKEALQRDPRFVDARLMLAGLYSTSHEGAQAVAEYDRILKQDPKHEEAAIFKAQVQTEEGDPSAALATLKAFVKRNSDSALAYYYLGRSEQGQNHFKEAVVAFRKALVLRPGFTQAALALGFLYEEKKMSKQAVEVYKDMYESSQDLGAANRLATLYLKDEKFMQALPYLEAIEAADADDMNVRVKLGLIRMELKEYDRAISTFKSILARNPDSDRIHYYLGSLYEETKKYDEAMTELKAIKPTSKLFTDAALHVGYLTKQGPGGAKAAKAYISEAISKSPETASFYIFSASLDEEAKDVSGAVATLEAAARKFPEDEKVRYYLGSLYDRRGEIDKGLEQMEAILKVNPENVDALNYIGYTWTVKGIRLGDAEKLLKRALSLRPENGYIRDSWGWYLFTRGRTPEAVVELEKAAKMKPNESTILEHLADAYVRANLWEKALSQYRNAVRYAEDDELRRKLQGKADNLQHDIAQQGGGSRTGDRVPAGAGATAMPSSETR